MNASGLMWLSVFPLVGGALAAWVMRRGELTEARRTAAYYLLIGSYGMVGLLTAQLAWALHKVESPRIDDGGVTWLGAGLGRLAFSVDSVSLAVIGSAVVLGLGALLAWTRVGTRLERGTLSLLAWGSMALGLCAFMASSRSLVAPVGAWMGLSFMRIMSSGDEWDEARGPVDRARTAWEGISVLGMGLMAGALALAGGSTDLLHLRTAPIDELRQLLVGLPLAEWACIGLVVSLGSVFIASTRPPLASSEGEGKDERLEVQSAFARVWMMTVLPWFALALRIGKLFALAPTSMAVLSVLPPLLVAASVWPPLTSYDARASEPGQGVVRALRIHGSSSWLGAGVVLGCFAMGTTWGALLALWGFGSVALVRSALMDAGAHQQQAPVLVAGLGVFGVGGLALGELLFASVAHDSLASPGINYLVAALWASNLFVGGLGVGCCWSALAIASRSTWLSWTAVSAVLLASLWPADLGGFFVPHTSLGLDLVYGSFSDSAIEFHVGTRAEYLDLDGRPLMPLRAAGLVAAFALPAVGLWFGKQGNGAVELLRQFAGQFQWALSAVRELPGRVGVGLELAAHGLAEFLGETSPLRARELVASRAHGLRERTQSWWPEPGARQRLAWAALFFLLFGWLYLKPSVSTLLPTRYHSFGGLRPQLHRPADPSAERRARQKRARDEALEAQGLSTEPQIKKVEREGVFQPERPLE